MTAEKRSTRPTVAEMAKSTTCPNCGGSVIRRGQFGPKPTYCDEHCKRAMANRFAVRGAAIIGLAQAWRRARGSGEIAKEAFAEVCAILDAFNAEDREAGRPPADLYAAKLINSGTRYLDRRRA